MWGVDQFTSAKGAYQSLQPLLDKLSNISLTRALSIMRVWGSVQQLRGYPYPWGIDGDLINYECEENDELFGQLRYFWVMAMSVYPPYTLEAYFGDSVKCQSSSLLEKHFPHAQILAESSSCDGLVPAYALCNDPLKKQLVLVIRGSVEVTDWLINFSCDIQEANCHNGFWKSANILLNEVRPLIEEFLEKHEDYSLHVTGHSMGAGVSCIIAILLKARYPTIKAWCFAPPKCVSEDLSTQSESYITSICYGRDVVSRACFATTHIVLSVLDELGQYSDFDLLGLKHVDGVSPPSTIDEVSPVTTPAFDVLTLQELDTMLVKRLNCFNEMFGFPQEIHRDNFLDVMIHTLKNTIRRSLASEEATPAPEPPILTSADRRRTREWDGLRSNPPSAAETTRCADQKDKGKPPTIQWFMTEVTKQIVEGFKSPRRDTEHSEHTLAAENADEANKENVEREQFGGSFSSSDGNSNEYKGGSEEEETEDLESLIHGYFQWPWKSSKSPEVASPSTEAPPPAQSSFVHGLMKRVAQSVFKEFGGVEESPELAVREFLDELSTRVSAAYQGSEDEHENVTLVLSEYRRLVGEKLRGGDIAISDVYRAAGESLYARFFERLHADDSTHLQCPGRIIQIIPLSHLVSGDPGWTKKSLVQYSFCQQLWKRLSDKNQPLPSHLFVDATRSRGRLYDVLFKSSSFEDHSPGSYTKALVPDIF